MSGPIVSLNTIIELCQNKKWGEMPMNTQFKEMAPKVLLVAFRQTHEENSKFSLDDYDQSLMKSYGNLYSSNGRAVYLNDFTRAHRLSVHLLNDDAVAETISNYVKKHASVLGWMLKDCHVPKTDKEKALESFPFLENVELTPESEIIEPTPSCPNQ